MKQIEEAIQRSIRFMLGILHINAKESTVRTLTQFVKFGIVGASNTLLSYLIHVVVLLALQPLHWHWDYVLGNILAFLLSVLWSFYWNNKYVFTREEGEQRSPWKTLLKTYLSYGFTGLLLSNLLAYLWVDVLGISKFISPLLNLIISIPVNFILNKKWAFKTKSESLH